MPVSRPIVTGTERVTQAQIDAAIINLLNNVPEMKAVVEKYRTSSVALKIIVSDDNPYDTLFGGTVPTTTPVGISGVVTEIIISIPLNYIDGDYYFDSTDTEHEITFERALVHELLHAENYIDSNFVPDTPAQAQQEENDVRAAENEILQKYYSEKPRDFNEPIIQDGPGTPNAHNIKPANETGYNPWSNTIGAVMNGGTVNIAPTAGGGGVCPLILDLDGDGIEVTKMGYGVGSATTYFDLDNDGYAERSAWVTGGDGLLARDLNGNGIIDNKTELFGDNPGFADGFAQLRSLDSNSSNSITSADTAWATMRVWLDADGDAVTDAGELKTMVDLGITSISLATTAQTNLFNNENAVTATSTFTINGQSRAVHDVWFRNDNLDSRYMTDVELDVRTLFLPTLKGTGNMADLHVAMSENEDLLDLVEDFVTGWSLSEFTNPTTLDNDVKAILFKWAGVDTYAANATVHNVNARVFYFLEKLTGLPYQPAIGLPSNQNLTAAQVDTLNKAFDIALQNFKAALILQSGGAGLFDDPAVYNIATGRIEGDPTLDTSAIANFGSTIAVGGVKHQAWGELTKFLIHIQSKDSYTSAEMTALNTAYNHSTTWSVLAANTEATNGYTINGSDKSDLLMGYRGADWLYGLQSDDQIYGMLAGDNIFGGDGNDYLDGGEGNDWIRGDAGNDTIVGGWGDDTLENNVSGSGNDTYIYNLGDGFDVIKDYHGSDTIQLGEGITAGNVTFQRVFGIGQAQIDLNIYINGVVAMNLYYFFQDGANYKLETLKFSDNSTIDLTQFANTTAGGSGNDTINGLDNTLLRDDHILGNAGNDTLNGGLGNDYINGGNGNDTLSGGAGDDLLLGGQNDDTYVYAAGTGQGLDTVSDEHGIDMITLGSGYTSANVSVIRSGQYDLFIRSGSQDLIKIIGHFNGGSATIETLKYGDNSTLNLLTFSYLMNGTASGDSLTGTFLRDTIYGGDGADYITSNAENDTIYGEGGNDTLIGGLGNDAMHGGAGNDTYYVDVSGDTVTELSNEGTDLVYSEVSYSLGGNVENLTLNGSSNVNATGNSLVNILTGNSGNNTLDGQGGADTMAGGAGNDTYVVDNTGDVVTESSSAGTDTIQSSVTYTLSANVENLTLTNSANIDGTGNSLTNIINGNSGNNLLTGGDGADTLYGLDGLDTLLADGGIDTLYGGNGADVFKFATSSMTTIDIIKDYSAAQSDVIHVKDLLVGYDPLTKVITDYIEMTTSGSNTVMRVDRDGLGTTYSWTQVATIEAVTGMTDEAALVTQGRLVVS